MSVFCLFRSAHHPRRVPATSQLLRWVLAGGLLLPIGALAQSYYDRQAQNREYQRLQDATRRAYNVPNPPAPSSSGRSSSGRSSSSSSYSPAPSSSGSSAPNLQPFGAGLQRLSNTMNRRVEPRKKVFETDPRLNPQNQAASGPEAKPARNLTYPEIVAARYSGSTKPTCDGDCQETLTLVDGSGTYVGNTLNGWPNDKGILTRTNGQRLSSIHFYFGDAVGVVHLELSDGTVYTGTTNRADEYSGMGKLTLANGDYEEGLFDHNKLNGQGTRVRAGQAERGLWKDGEPVGPRTTGPAATLAAVPQRLTYANGQVFEGILKNGQRAKGKLTFADGQTFQGTFSLVDDFNGPLLGRDTFANGHWFEGEHKSSGNPYRGTYSCPEYVFVGQLYYGDTGRMTRSDKVVTHGATYDTDNKRKGYCHERLPDGNVTERIYYSNVPQPQIIYHRPGGEVLAGLVDTEGHRFFGISKTKAGLSKPVALNQAGQWLTLPETDRTKAEDAARTATEVIDKSRAAYNEEVKWKPSLQIAGSPPPTK